MPLHQLEYLQRKKFPKTVTYAVKLAQVSYYVYITNGATKTKMKNGMLWSTVNFIMGKGYPFTHAHSVMKFSS